MIPIYGGLSAPLVGKPISSTSDPYIVCMLKIANKEHSCSIFIQVFTGEQSHDPNQQGVECTTALVGKPISSTQNPYILNSTNSSIFIRVFTGEQSHDPNLQGVECTTGRNIDH